MISIVLWSPQLWILSKDVGARVVLRMHQHACPMVITAMHMHMSHACVVNFVHTYVCVCV